MSINKDSIDQSQSPLDFKGEPIWFHSFLTLFNCESIPKILFTRASQPITRWDDAGELVRIDLNYLRLVHPRFEGLLGQPSWSERYTDIDKRRSYLEDLIECGDAVADEIEKLNRESLLAILTIVASAFPEPWCEIIWEDLQEELWVIVESTCLPLLGVLDINDVKICLGLYPQNRESEFLFMLIAFFIRVSVLLVRRTPPNLLQLISKSIELFRDQVKVGKDTSQEDLDYLLLSKSVAEILMDRDQVSMAAERLQSLSHKGSMRANAAIGFALGTLPTSRMGFVSNEYSKWTPILLDAPSTMEVLVQSQLFGTISLEQLSITGLEDLSLPMKVRMGFAEARKKAFFNAAGILEPLIGEVEKAYGKASREFLLVATALVNSFNATKREVDGENLGRYVWSNFFGSFTTIRPAGPVQQTYLMVAISDSFLGQGKYVEARKLLLDVLHRISTDNNLFMSATLRLLKMSRRERSPSTLFEDWTRLGNAVRRFDKLSDTLKYECIEETVCLLSVLEPDQMAKIPEASRIVKTLTDYRINTHKGSTPSRLNLHRNLEELKRLKSKLNLFSISGPQLSYCRKLRERFLPASVQIIEKVGSANWQRFKRIKEIREMEAPNKVELQTPGPAKLAFQDSDLGSSLNMDSIVPSHPEAARSVTSIRSFMSREEDAILLPPVPPETSTGERICFICKNLIEDVENESQWRRHAFSDLRPYVCIIDECDADCMKFTSRATFAAHLSEHQHINMWTCAQCGHTEEKKSLIRDHVNFKHATGDNGHQNVDIIQKSIPRDLSSQSCPFCGEVPGAVKFVGHLCHHLEEISLSAIPRDAGVDEDDEGSSSLGGSLSRKRIEELGGRFDEPFDEMDTAGETKPHEFSRDEDSPSIPLPFETASQKLEQGLQDEFMDGADICLEDEEVQTPKSLFNKPQDLESQGEETKSSLLSPTASPKRSDDTMTMRGLTAHGAQSSIQRESLSIERTTILPSGQGSMPEGSNFPQGQTRGSVTPTSNLRLDFSADHERLQLLLAKQQEIQVDAAALLPSPSSDPKLVVPGLPQEGELAPLSHGDFTVEQDPVATSSPKVTGDLKRPRAETVPQGFLNHTISSSSTSSPIIVSQEPASIDKRSLRPRHNRRPYKNSDSGIGSSMASASAKRSAELAPKMCREPGCYKEFKRPADLTKHEKTHSRPWKCPVESCRYHEYGWPTEKEMDRHHNDKHSATASFYECHFKPCPYKSKRESNLKQHMEKAHGWTYIRSKNKGKNKNKDSVNKNTHSVNEYNYTPNSVDSGIGPSIIGESPAFTPYANDDNPGHPYDFNQPEITGSSFNLFDNEDIFSAGVQLPYPGDFTSFAKDGEDSVAIQGIESSQYRYPPDEGFEDFFEDFVPSASTGNDFKLFPSSTLPSSTSTAALGLAGQELLNFYAASTAQLASSDMDRELPNVHAASTAQPAPSNMDWQNDLRSR